MPKSAASKPPTVPSKPPPVSATLSLSSPKQQSKLKPHAPALHLQCIPNPVLKQANESENGQKIEPEKCPLTESNQNDCKKVEVLKQFDEKGMDNANNATEKEAADCKLVEIEAMKKVMIAYLMDTCFSFIYEAIAI